MNISISPKSMEYNPNNNKKQEKIDLEKKYLYPDLKVGIIMPAFNEQMNIGKTLSLIPHNISDKLDVIVVDDGSTDDTYKIAEQFSITILRHGTNRGNGAAIQTGLEYCKKRKYDIIVIIDADGQHEPKYIKDFLKPIVEEKYDYVIGNRFHYYYDMGIVKKICSQVMSLILSLILGQRISDPTMGYRALSKKVALNLEFVSNYSITLEMLFKIVPFFKSCEIPVKINQRLYGASFIKLEKYFYKTLFSFTKFYLFPIVHRYSHRYVNRRIRKRVFKLVKT